MRWVDESELATSQNNQTTTINTNTNTAVTTATTSINSNTNSAVSTATTSIRGDIAFIESKLDVNTTGALVNIESKLDDDLRWVDESELATSQNSQTANINTNTNTAVTNATTSINTNTNTAVSAATTSINSNTNTAVTNATTSIRGDIAFIESKLDVNTAGALAQIESKLDDDTRWIDESELNTSQTSQTTTINTNTNTQATNIRTDIAFLESKLDLLTNNVDGLGCILIDLLLTPEKLRCTDTASCGFGAFPSGLESVPTPATCRAAGFPLTGLPGRAPESELMSLPATGPGAASASAGASLASIEALLLRASDAAAGLRLHSRSFIATALRSEEIDPLLLMTAAESGLFDEVAAFVREAVSLYRGFRVDPNSLLAAEDAFGAAERLRAEGQRSQAYRGYRTAYRNLIAASKDLQ